MATQTELSLVKVVTVDGLATITIDRPELLNSLNFAVLHQLRQAFLAVIADSSVRGIVLSGEGKAFVVGADIEFFIRNVAAGDIPRIEKYTEAGHALMNTIDQSPKPVVARVNGTALGGGVELALACDVIVAAVGANFGFPETGLGIYPGFGGTQRTPRKVGVGLAKWLICTGKTISANEAGRIGLADQVVPAEELDGAARNLALSLAALPPRGPLSAEHANLGHFFATSRAEALRTGTANTGGDLALARAMKLVANKAPIALRLAETMIEQGSARTLDAGLQMEIDHVREIFTTEDARLGLNFRASRQLGQPAFTGK